jgi:hypothetical protein
MSNNSKREKDAEYAKTTVLELIGDLKDNIFDKIEEKGDLMLVEFYFRRMHPERVISHVSKLALPHKDKIQARDLNFFLENKEIFAGLPSDRIEYYSSMIAAGSRLSSEDRKIIWAYFDTFIALAESYENN